MTRFFAHSIIIKIKGRDRVRERERKLRHPGFRKGKNWIPRSGPSKDELLEAKTT